MSVQLVKMSRVCSCKIARNAHGLNYRSQTDFSGTAVYFKRLFRTGNYRLCIRHCNYSSVAACTCGTKPGKQILLLRKAGIPEMNVHINKCRSNSKSFCVQIRNRIIIFVAVLRKNCRGKRLYGFCAGKISLKYGTDFSLNDKHCTRPVKRFVKNGCIVDKKRVIHFFIPIPAYGCLRLPDKAYRSIRTGRLHSSCQQEGRSALRNVPLR